MNHLNRHVLKALKHRHLVPVSDVECTWNYWNERWVVWVWPDGWVVCVSECMCVRVCVCVCVFACE